MLLQAPPAPATLPPVQVLFLGDQGHHEPRKRFDDARAALAADGIQLEYSEDLARLSAAGLADKDVLCVYANIDELPPAREAALLAWIEAGHGLVALHSASYCFRNSDAWIALVGGQFEQHGAGWFRTRLVDPEHPIFRGLLPFESWDETYVHTRHASDRQVLELRVEGEREEPYTWTRTQGQGRVFYTAWGHDQRTWKTPGFQELLRRGLRWTAGDASWRVPALPERKLEDARVPIYGERGGQRAETKRPAPLTPEESLLRAHVPAGYEIELLAHEPVLTSPLALAFDIQGRPWVCESQDYPNERAPDGQGRDSIRILLDEDGDGRFERAQVFADRLSLPTSLCFSNGGVIVTAPPHTLFLKDNDGDGRADERRVLFSGWGTDDTHAGPSHLRYGFDNWIWGTVGYSGFDGEVGGKRLRFGQGLYRFKPDGSELEFIASTTNNTWGMSFTNDGDVVCSTANHEQLNLLGIPNRVYESVPGLHGRGVEYIADYERVEPLGDDLRQVDWHGQFTAASGATAYTGWNPDWREHVFVCEPTAHLVNMARLVEPADRGSGRRARDAGNLVASTDPWFAPIAVECGPDGALWVLDWYSYVVQHNPTPRGFETGAGAAYVTPERDRTRARLYRIALRGWPRSLQNLEGASDQQLLGLLQSNDLLWRSHAQRLLVERGSNSVPATLPRDALRRRPRTQSALPPMNDPWMEQHYLRILEGQGRVEDLARAFDAACLGQGISSHELMALAPSTESSTRWLLAKSPMRPTTADGFLGSPDARVVRDALLALARMPADAEAGQAIFRATKRADFPRDAWTHDAAIAAGARHAEGFLAALLASARGDAPRVEPPAPRNLLPNPDLEAVRADGLPAAWRRREYSGSSQLSWVAEGRNGGHCLRIDSEAGADTSWFVDVSVAEAGHYELSGWVRTRGVTGAMGALFNLHTHPAPALTEAIRGDNDWTRVRLEFEAEAGEELSINALFGGWGRSRGTAWYDDVALVRRPDPAGLASLDREEQRRVRLITGAWARRGQGAELAGVLAAAGAARVDLAAYVVDALAHGLPQTSRATDPNIEPRLRALLARREPELAGAAFLLASRVGVARSADEQARFEQLQAELLARCGDASLAVERRVASARAALELDAGAASALRLCALLDARLDPDLARGWIELLGTVEHPDLPATLLACWPRLAPAARREALAQLLARPAGCEALAQALAASTLGPGELDAAQWRVLEQRLGADRVAALRSRGAPRAAQGAEFERLKPALTLAGDAERGRALFAQHCATCHAFGGTGGDVGPALDGSAARGRLELLSEIVDPNRSVEANFRLWSAFLEDDRLVSGRILRETATSVELVDAQAKRHVLERAEIAELRAEPVSVMPERLLEPLSVEEVAALLAFLGAR